MREVFPLPLVSPLFGARSPCIVSPLGNGGVGPTLLSKLAPLSATLTTPLCSHAFAESISEPELVYNEKLTGSSGGGTVRVSDYLDAYRWLEEKTPDDARVLAWYVGGEASHP